MTTAGNSRTIVSARSTGCRSPFQRIVVGVEMEKLSRAAAVVCGLPIGLVLAAPAHGSGDAVSGYVDDHGAEVCGFMRDQPNLAGVKHAVDHILATSGLPEDQTGRLLAGSVSADCPEDGQLVEEFVWYIHRRQQSSNGSAGTGITMGY